jgi:hypothetical protein
MKEFCQKKDSGYFGRLPNLLMRKTTPNGEYQKNLMNFRIMTGFSYDVVTSFKSSSFFYIKRCNKADLYFTIYFSCFIIYSKPFIFTEACLFLNTLLEMNLSYYLGIITWLFQLFHIGQHTQWMLFCFYYDPIQSIWLNLNHYSD